MKLTQIIFSLLAFAIFKAMVLSAAAPTQMPDVPTLTFPNLELFDVTFESAATTCDGQEWLWWTGIGTVYCAAEAFATSAADTAEAIMNIVLCVYWFVLCVFNVTTFIGKLVIFVGQILITGIDGPAAWVNILLLSPFAIGFAIIIYKLFRKGDSTD